MNMGVNIININVTADVATIEKSHVNITFLSQLYS